MYSDRTELYRNWKPTATPIFMHNAFEKIIFHFVKHLKVALMVWVRVGLGKLSYKYMWVVRYLIRSFSIHNSSVKSRFLYILGYPELMNNKLKTDFTEMLWMRTAILNTVYTISFNLPLHESFPKPIPPPPGCHFGLTPEVPYRVLLRNRK